MNRQIRAVPKLTLVALALLLAAPAIAGSVSGSRMAAVTCQSLADSATQPRWLTLPMSRLVINPFLGQYGDHTPRSSGLLNGVLPLDLAYYAGDHPARLPNFWYVAPLHSPAAVVAGQRLDLSVPEKWQTVGVKASFEANGAGVTPNGDFGAITRTVTVDLDLTPYLYVQTPPGSPSFDMKVNTGDQPVDTFLKPVNLLGGRVGDVRAATGWQGTRTFKILLYALGKGRTTTFTRVQFLGLPSPQASHAPEERAWMPQEITATAHFDAGGNVQGTVTMPDVDTVAERFRVQTGPALMLEGRFDGRLRWDPARRALLLQGARFSAAIGVSRPVRWLGSHPESLAWALGEDAGGDGGGSPGTWRMVVEGLKPGEDVVVAARFIDSPGDAAKAAAGARAEASPSAFAAAERRQEAAWNRRLARVPQPLDFTPRAAASEGVTPDEVRRTYYRAWVFLYDDTLPPTNDFLYPQVCAGKPSLWTEGAPRSEETATWDSFYAMQALALVDPQTAWAAAQGILSQVDSDGYLYGEALATVFARTFWLLYEETGDTGRLHAVYPALKRYLLWKIANPRWIFPNRTKPAPAADAPKDQEFVSFEIVDAGYAARIAQALHLPSEAVFWRQQQRAALADYLRWFWPTPGGPVYRIYNSGADRGGPNEPWSLQGLQIPPPLLPAEDAAALAALYRKTMNPALPFLVPGRTRFGDLEPITLGLFEHGQVGAAAQLTDACMSDVTRAGDFSEDYIQTNPPVPDGVRPSAFGARLMIDSVLWHNGAVLDRGFPVILGMPGAVGVENVPVGGAPVDIRFGAPDGKLLTVTLDGPGLAHLHLPAAFHVVHAAGQGRWVGTIPEGAQIPIPGR
ncbi:MAG TPA: hypothetical protein VFJ58_16090 [Armatimonadota bacterium]|nr:hypothetical protein [Armatimonadota bacterium]